VTQFSFDTDQYTHPIHVNASHQRSQWSELMMQRSACTTRRSHRTRPHSSWQKWASDLETCRSDVKTRNCLWTTGRCTKYLEILQKLSPFCSTHRTVNSHSVVNWGLYGMV